MWGKRHKLQQKKAINNFMKWYITTQTSNNESTVREALDYIKRTKSTLIYDLNQKKIGWNLHGSTNFMRTLKYSKKYKQELNHWKTK